MLFWTWTLLRACCHTFDFLLKKTFSSTSGPLGKQCKNIQSFFAKNDCIFLHCLPRGPEVDEKVFFSKKSKVWQQALNRVHVQKSILLYCFGKLR